MSFKIKFIILPLSIALSIMAVPVLSSLSLVSSAAAYFLNLNIVDMMLASVGNLVFLLKDIRLWTLRCILGIKDLWYIPD